MRTFRLVKKEGKIAEIAEDELIEMMRGYAALFTTCYPGDAEKAYERFSQIIGQLTRPADEELVDGLAKVVEEAISAIISRPDIEPYLEYPLLILGQIGTRRSSELLINIIKMKGDDDELLFKREMAAEKVVHLPYLYLTVPEELTKIALGKQEFSRSQRRIATWALAQLIVPYPQVRTTLQGLKEDGEVGDLVKP